MLDSDQLLAIGVALVKTVRSVSKYSPNMDKENQLFDGLHTSYLYKNEISKINLVRKEPYTFMNLGQKSLEQKTGLCDELSLACLYIASGLSNIVLDEEYFLSQLSCYGHAFVLIHQSNELKNQQLNKNIENSWDDLLVNIQLSNAIIVDPWVNKATKLSNLDSHLGQAKKYHVDDYYTTDKGIKLKTPEHIIINNFVNNKNIIEDNYIKIFSEFYAEQKQKLLRHSLTYGDGRDFNSYKGSMLYNIQQQQQLTSLIDFFTRLKNHSSWFYSTFMHSDRKGQVLTSVINYLSISRDNYNYPSDNKLNDIFKGVLSIIVLIRGKAPPNNLTVNNVHMASTAEGLFDLTVTPVNKLSFEDISGLSQDFIRGIRNKNRIERYSDLLQVIYPNTVDYTFLYQEESKVFLYSALNELIST